MENIESSQIFSSSVFTTKEKKLIFTNPYHQTTLQKHLYKQWLQGQNCDLIINAGSCSLPVHSCVVSCFSAKISNLLLKAEMQYKSASAFDKTKYSVSENGVHFDFFKNGEKKIGITADQEIVKTLIGFMYSGSLSISNYQLMWLLKIAQLLDFSFIVNAVKIFITRNVDTVGVQILPAMYLASSSSFQPEVPGLQQNSSLTGEGDGGLEPDLQPGYTQCSELHSDSQTNTTGIDTHDIKQEILSLDRIELAADIKPDTIDDDLKAFLDCSSETNDRPELAADIKPDTIDDDLKTFLDCPSETNDRPTENVSEIISNAPTATDVTFNPNQVVGKESSSALTRTQDVSVVKVKQEPEDVNTDDTEKSKSQELQTSEEPLTDNVYSKHMSCAPRVSDRGENNEDNIECNTNSQMKPVHRSAGVKGAPRATQGRGQCQHRKTGKQKTCLLCSQCFADDKDLKRHKVMIHGDFLCETEEYRFKTIHASAMEGHQKKTQHMDTGTCPSSACSHSSSTSRAKYTLSECDMNFLQKSHLSLHQRAVHKSDKLQEVKLSDQDQKYLDPEKVTQQGLNSASLSLCTESSSVDPLCNASTRPEESSTCIGNVAETTHSKICHEAREEEEGSSNGQPAQIPILQESGSSALPVKFKGCRKRLCDNNFKCQLCSKKLGSKEERFQHLRDEHWETSFHCKQCLKSFPYQQFLTKHVLVEHQLRHWTCCEQDFTVGAQFAAHCLSVHGDKKPFRCSEPSCSFKGSTLNAFTFHKMHVHAKERKEVCAKCGSCFANKLYLRNHQRRCVDSEKHLCPICGLTFPYPQSLGSHINTKHRGERRYICGQCGRRFSCHGNRARHMRIHNNVFPYMCDVCGQNFRHSNSLKQHMQQKHDKGR